MKGLLLMIGKPPTIIQSKDKSFSFEEYRDIIKDKCGDMVEMVDLPGNRTMVLNEEGKIYDLPINEEATAIWKKLYPIADYPHNNDELVVGNVLITGSNLEKLIS